MTSYQETLLSRLESLANNNGAIRVQCSRSMKFSNEGRLIVHNYKDLSTVATLDFDFQSERVTFWLNSSGRKHGPRNSQIFWWQIGNDDAEQTRFLDAWTTAVTDGAQKVREAAQ